MIDERASPEQREALLKILSGQETEPFATIFSVVAAMTETVHEPLFRPIEFEADPGGAHRALLGRRAGRGQGRADPQSRSPATPHRARVSAAARLRVHRGGVREQHVEDRPAPIENDWTGRHAHFCMLHMGPNGVIH